MPATMGKKRTSKISEDFGSIDPISFRPDDARFGEALNELARQNHRNRTQTIIMILEEKLREAGLWPPKN